MSNTFNNFLKPLNMIKMKKIMAYLFLGVIMFGVSCKKYEEGPSISFLSDSKRLCQEWALVSDYDAGTGETTTNSAADANDFTTFNDDGTGTMTVSSFIGNVDLDFTWEFVDDAQLSTTISGLATSTETITKLSSKSFGLDLVMGMFKNLKLEIKAEIFFSLLSKENNAHIK